MRRVRMLAAVLVLVCAAGAGATELVGVRGSSTQFTTTMSITAGGKPVQLVLTGVALRQKLFLNVYAIASYVAKDAGVRTAEELAAIDQPKQLHLVMERNVSGPNIAEAFTIAIRQNYPEPAFAAEVNRLAEMLRGNDLAKGDHIYITHLPGVGLHAVVVGKADFTIPNVDFSRAVWDIYLGKNNVGESIKKGLVSRLHE